MHAWHNPGMGRPPTHPPTHPPTRQSVKERSLEATLRRDGITRIKLYLEGASKAPPAQYKPKVDALVFFKYFQVCVVVVVVVVVVCVKCV